MPETLKCPTCSAPLDFPAGGATSVHCPYCNNTVLLSGTAAPTPGSPAVDIAAAFAPMIGRAMEMADVMALMSAGNKIGAIKVYRQRSGAGLAVAKKAVEDMAAGRPVMPHITGRQVAGAAAAATTVASTGLMLGCGTAIGIIVIVALVLSLALRTARHQVTSAVTARQSWTPTLPTPLPMAKTTAVPAPTFARNMMEFGSEGIGAGQFKDARSIALDGNGHIYVGDYSDGRVQVFDTDGKFQSAWSIGHDKSLLNLTADRKGTVYAVVPAHILRFEATGNALGEVENMADDGREFYMDAFVALNGEIWAVGTNSDIIALDSEGRIKKILKSREKVGEDVNFSRVIVLSTGEIYALDRNKGVFKFDGGNGRYINRFGGGEGRGQFLAPQNLAADGKGRIYVSGANAPVQVFDGEGRYIDSFGGNDVAFGLAIDDQNAVYACFRNRNSIRKYVLEK